MRFPSLKNLAQSALSVIRRFPLELAFAMAGTIAATYQIEVKYIDRIRESWCIRTIMMANLGLLLSLAATLYTESKAMPRVNKMLLRAGAALLAFGVLFLINPYERTADYIRFFLLSLAMHLLVAFAAYTGKGHLQGFWQFNKTLFLRFLASVLYSTVLFLGLAAAIGAMNLLFNFAFEWDTYAILWVWIAGMFNTLFFLAGVPADTAALDVDQSYPKGLKVFTQYVLIPLATVYLAILLAYEVKILVQWQLPKGMVSSLILGYAVFGILSLLLVYPIREQEENKWIKTYARSFYFLMLPLLVLLYLAVGKRLGNYGITEFRYFLIMLACWLLFITIYFLVSRKQNIKIIPVSLAIITLLSVYGPQSAFNVAIYSQRGILKRIMERNHAFENGKFKKVDPNKINKKDANRAVATLEYLTEHGDLDAVQPYISKDLDAVSDSLGKLKGNLGSNHNFPISRYELRSKKLEWLKEYLGLSNFSGLWYTDEEPANGIVNNNVQSKDQSILMVKGYDYELRSETYSSDTLEVKLNNMRFKSVQLPNNNPVLYINNESVTFDARAIAKDLLSPRVKLNTYKLSADEGLSYQNYEVPQKLLYVVKETNRYKVALKIDMINFNTDKKGGLMSVDIIKGVYLIKVK
jgi:hypothetical protein